MGGTSPFLPGSWTYFRSPEPLDSRPLSDVDVYFSETYHGVGHHLDTPRTRDWEKGDMEPEARSDSGPERSRVKGEVSRFTMTEDCRVTVHEGGRPSGRFDEVLC